MPTFLVREKGKPERLLTTERAAIRIGRDTRADIRLEDASIARMHAVIDAGDGALTVVDLGSGAGTFVNDERTNRRVLAPGDRIRIGDSTIVLTRARPRELQLPTPEAVRAIEGDSFRPHDVFGIAALVLHVDGIRREAWSDEAELSERLFASYPRGAVPPPEEPTSQRGTYKTIDDAAPTRARRCSTCIIKPGFSPCTLCMGTGAGSGPDPHARCIACDEGFVRCTDCEGTTRVVACTIRYVNDQLFRVRRAIVPNMHASIRPFVEATLPIDARWPDEHAFDPEPSLVGSAYRGASTVKAAEDFHGFFFGDAIASCLAARAELTTGLARFETACFAIPILWTVSGDRHDAYFFDTADALQHIAQG